MKKLDELQIYIKENQDNKKLTKNLYWYKKHKGLKWLKGQNFGDYLSTIIVANTVKLAGFHELNIPRKKKLLAIGSIIHFGNDNDIVWGSGVNGKIEDSLHKFHTLDVRAVRGPLTQKFLHQKKIRCENIFGDPALLLPYFLKDLKKNTVNNKIIVIPNLNEYTAVKELMPNNLKLINPLSHWSVVLDEILSSDLVLTSSLHGLILSEAFNVNVKLFKPFGGETMFKYEDYIEGTGRSMPTVPNTFLKGIDENNGIYFKKLSFKTDSLLESFPYEYCK